MSLEWEENEESGYLKAEADTCQYWIVDSDLIIVTVDAAGANETKLPMGSSFECQLYAECLECEKKMLKLDEKIEDLTTDTKILEAEVLIKARVIKQLEQQLEGSRQHKTEVNQDDQ